jgi:hypothetical protein
LKVDSENVNMHIINSTVKYMECDGNEHDGISNPNYMNNCIKGKESKHSNLKTEEVRMNF